MKELPFGGEFSPNQIDLRWLLSQVQARPSPGDLKEAIRAKYFVTSCTEYSGAERRKQQLKRAGNVVIGLRNYGLLDANPKAISLTPLGSTLVSGGAAARDDFARHILTDLHGFEVINAAQAVAIRDGKWTKATLASQLTADGFAMPRATTKHMIMLLWLGWSGLIQDDHTIDQRRLAILLGADEGLSSEIDALSNDDRKFLRALAQISGTHDAKASISDVRNLAERLYGLRWPEDRIQTKLKPLEESGWITLERGTRGRGAKSGFVAGTARLQSEFVAKLLEKEAALSPDLRAGLRRPFREIVDELGSSETYVKGKALELLALQLSRFLGMTPRKWRLRSVKTGGAEVDLIVESAVLTFSRWQIQCKNTASVSLDDLAKEIGLAQLLKSNIIAMVTTGRFGSVVREYANTIMDQTNLQVIFIDGQGLGKVRESTTPALELTSQIASQSKEALRLKAKQIMIDVED